MKALVGFLLVSLAVAGGYLFLQQQELTYSRNEITAKTAEVTKVQTQVYDLLVDDEDCRNDMKALSNMYYREVNRTDNAEKRLKSIQGSLLYTVQSGDTLSELARTFLKDGKKWQDIKQFNNISGETIYEGQTLVINTYWKGYAEKTGSAITEYRNKDLIGESFGLATAEMSATDKEFTVEDFGLNNRTDVPNEFIRTTEGKKSNFSPSLHAVLPGGLAITSDKRTFGTFTGIEGFAFQTGDGNLKFGGAGLNWNIEFPADNDQLALTVTPISARLYKRLYASGGYSHVFAGDKNRAANGAHIQFSYCFAGCN